MHAEVVNLDKRQNWDVPQRDLVLEGANNISETWAFKYKCRPDSTFQNFNY